MTASSSRLKLRADNSAPDVQAYKELLKQLAALTNQTTHQMDAFLDAFEPQQVAGRRAEVMYTVQYVRTPPAEIATGGSSFSVSGSVSVSNPAPLDAKLAGITVSITNPTGRTLPYTVEAECPTGITVTAGRTLDCKWIAKPLFDPTGAQAYAMATLVNTANGIPSRTTKYYASAPAIIGGDFMFTRRLQRWNDPMDFLSKMWGESTSVAPKAATNVAAQTMQPDVAYTSVHTSPAGQGHKAPDAHAPAPAPSTPTDVAAPVILPLLMASPIPVAYSQTVPAALMPAPQSPLSTSPAPSTHKVVQLVTDTSVTLLAHNSSMLSPTTVSGTAGNSSSTATPADSSSAAMRMRLSGSSTASSSASPAPLARTAAAGSPSTTQGVQQTWPDMSGDARSKGPLSGNKRVGTAAGRSSAPLQAGLVPPGLRDECVDVAGHELPSHLGTREEEGSLLQSKLVSGVRPSGRICSTTTFAYKVRYGPASMCGNTSLVNAATLVPSDSKEPATSKTHLAVEVYGCSPAVVAAVVNASASAKGRYQWFQEVTARSPVLQVPLNQVANNTYNVVYKRRVVVEHATLSVTLNVHNRDAAPIAVGHAVYAVNNSCGGRITTAGSNFTCNAGKQIPGSRQVSCSFSTPLACASEGAVAVNLLTTTGEAIAVPPFKFSAPVPNAVDSNAPDACVMVSGFYSCRCGAPIIVHAMHTRLPWSSNGEQAVNVPACHAADQQVETMIQSHLLLQE